MARNPTIFRIHLPPRDNVPRVDYCDVRAASREVAEEYVKLRWPELFAPPTLYGAEAPPK